MELILNVEWLRDWILWRAIKNYVRSILRLIKLGGFPGQDFPNQIGPEKNEI